MRQSVQAVILRRAALISILLGALLRAEDLSWTIGPFTRPFDAAPIITPRRDSLFQDPILKTPVSWESLHTFNPAAITRNRKVYLLYRAEDDSGTMQIGMHTSRLGLAVSDDGLHFDRFAQPVFYPMPDDQESREWPGGVEDPRIVEDTTGLYVLTYTQWNRERFSIGIATSKDLLHWTKYGPAFQHAGTRYESLQYKSGSIITTFDTRKNRLIAVRIQGKYWMYWGEGFIHLATSTDLLSWTPVENSEGKAIELMGPRAGHFDSAFPEAGPPAILTKKGIVLIYNGKNALTNGDKSLTPGTYAVGEALFDAKQPERLLDRREQPVFKPALPFEMTGQYAAGTTFAEGLVAFHNHYFLYYGCADSFVSIASSPLKF